MREALANTATMIRVSWAADRWRSVGALLTVTFLPLTGSMRAVGVAVVADGVVTSRSSRVTVGVIVIAVMTGAGHILEWASIALRMRLREHTVLYLDQRVMELVGGLLGLEHHERPGGGSLRAPRRTRAPTMRASFDGRSATSGAPATPPAGGWGLRSPLTW